MILVVLAAAAAGAVAGHEVWISTTTVQGAAPPSPSSRNANPFPGFGGAFSGNRQRRRLDEQHERRPRRTLPRSRTKVAPALVDINSSFGYQGAPVPAPASS